MSESNVLPSAPPHSVYPSLPEFSLQTAAPPSGENFRLNEISKIRKEISDEVEHYRLVLKKYKKTHKILHWAVTGLGTAATVLSGGAIASSVTGIGVIAGIPMASIAFACSGVSVSLTTFNRRVEEKIDKQTKIHATAVAKRESINTAVSKSLDDNSVTDEEFKNIVRENTKYNDLELSIRVKHKKRPVIVQESFTQTPPVDLDEIRQQVRIEEKKKAQDELRKKTGNLSSFELKWVRRNGSVFAVSCLRS